MDDIKDKAPGGLEYDTGMEDDRLVRRFQQGDETAFDRIVAKYSGEVCLLANRLLLWRGDVEDVAQDIFVSALLSLKRFEGNSSLRTWLFRITINRCRSLGSRKKLWLRYVSFKKDNYRGLPKATSSDQRLIGRETMMEVREAVESLDGKYREAVVLKYLHELDTEEVCSVLGISRGNLNVRLSRARELLKVKLKPLVEE